jgi:hypothetical protein
MLYLRPTARGDLMLCQMCGCVVHPADVPTERADALWLGADVECPYCGE